MVHQEVRVRARLGPMGLSPATAPPGGLQILHVDLELSLELAVLLDDADHLHRGLLQRVVCLLEDLGRHVALEDDALDDAGAVAHLEEVQLAASSGGGGRSQPAR